MVTDFRALSDLQIDVLKEIGNIGAGNAATALSKLMSDRVEMSVPQVKILSFAEVAETIGGAEAFVTGIYSRITGSASGGILFILPFTNAKQLLSVLLKQYPIRPSRLSNDLERSALMEVGNILTGSFLSALATFTSLSFFPSVPALCVDMAGALLGTVFHDLGKTGDCVLFVEAELRYQTNYVVGHLFFLLEAESLGIILRSLEVNF